MTTIERLERWRESGAIREEQCKKISALVRKERFSVFLELNVLLYLGVLSFVAGAGWTIGKYFADLGDAAIIVSLTILIFASFYYCFSRVQPYSNLFVEAPNLGFDYILYLGCLLLGVELGYLEIRFHLLDTQWDYYLLFLAFVYFLSAYRFDNRFVLSLALSTLAAWFGVKTSRFAFFELSGVRLPAIAYGVIVIIAGMYLHREGIKKHFIETYLHIASNVLLAALVSGVESKVEWWYLPAALTCAAVAIWGGMRYRRFAFIAYGIIYGYIAISMRIIDWHMGDTEILTYFLFSGVMVLVGMILLARRIGRHA